MWLLLSEWKKIRFVLSSGVFLTNAGWCHEKKQMDALILQHNQLFNKNEAWRKRLFPNTTSLFSRPAVFFFIVVLVIVPHPPHNSFGFYTFCTGKWRFFTDEFFVIAVFQSLTCGYYLTGLTSNH